VSSATRYRQLPSTGRSIGFELSTPSEIDVQPIERGDTLVRCRERRPDGKTVGELEVSVFKAALVIDRDGILEEKASEVADGVAADGAHVSAAVPVSLPGASGFRADVEPARATPAPLPYVHVFAIASHDLGVDGGVIVTVRSAAPEWPAAETIMKSLRILGRRSKTANDVGVDEPPALPMAPILGKKE
jgi:hypothetical protein